MIHWVCSGFTLSRIRAGRLLIIFYRLSSIDCWKEQRSLRQITPSVPFSDGTAPNLGNGPWEGGRKGLLGFNLGSATGQSVGGGH